MKSNHTFAAIGCVLVLSACGGGGGGGAGSASVSTPSATLSTITSVDASRAAENAFGSSYLIGNWSSSLPNLLAGVSVAPAAYSVVSPVFDLLKDAYRQDGDNLLTGVTRTYSCSGGGTLAIDSTLRDQSTASNGDTWTFTANNCVGKTNTQNGSISIKVSGVSGDIFHSDSGGITLDIVFNNFSTTQDVMKTAASGDMKISVTRTNSTDKTFVISGASLLETIQQSGVIMANRTLTSYTVSSSLQGSLLTSSANFSLSGSSNRLGQFSYTIKSVQPFIGTAGDMPTSGALIVNGVGSSVTMTATANGVRLDHSDNANGIITNSSTRIWTDFLSDY
jgi:hypothetical protein